MALHLHRAQRSDALVRGLAEVLSDPLPDPMAPEVVAVPAQGIERWISQRLSAVIGASGPERADGVSANIEFPSPARLVASTISLASGVAPQDDPWNPERLVWTVLAAIDDHLGAPGFEALTDHLGGPEATGGGPGDAFDPVLRATAVRRGRRLGVARRLAGLFDAYSRFRPSVLQAWAAGHDTDGSTGAGLPTAGSDGVALAAARAWQPALFRSVSAALPLPSPAQRLTEVVARLSADPAVSPLPSRIAIFGATRLSATELVVIDALAQHRDVHLFIPQPSPRLWAKLAHQRTERGLTRRRSDPTSGLPEHPLLRSLGRDSRELQLRLSAGTAPMVDHLHLDPQPDGPAGLTALQRLHRDLADDRRPPGSDGTLGERAVLDPDDASIRIYACHGRDRQIEVLRDVLVGLLADDPTLQPRDILVMCPDIELYAPLVLAAFGVGESAIQPSSHPGTGIRVRLADRALRRTNPVLDVVSRVLELADSRMTASDVLDFAALPPVRRRFSFDDDDLQQLHTWVADAGIRWGLNEPGRARFGLPGIRQNTWRAGLDRLLVGVAMSEDVPQYIGSALPLDDVDSSRVVLAGRFAEFVDRLALTAAALAGERPFAQWVQALSTAVDSLTAVSGSDAWQQEQAHKMLQTELDLAGDGGTRPLHLQDIRTVLADALQGRPSRSNFRTGELTICSMVPMRSVPHRVICLLGLDDGEFPRAGRVDGDDVLAVDPVVGERDRTSEDRQLLLDAIDAASEHLVFLYSGADHRTGAERPPAAALGEILDVLDASLQDGSGGSIRNRIHLRHPLQPFDDRNFLSGSALVAGRGEAAHPFSFDAAALQGATALQASALHLPTSAAFLVPTALPPLEHRAGDVVEVEQLIRFFEQPAARFLSDRLGLGSNWRDDPPLDELEAELDALQQWGIGERLVRLQLDGISRQRAIDAEVRRGTLPVGVRARAVVSDVAGSADALVAEGLRHQVGDRRVIDVAIGLGDGRAVVGTLGPVYDGRLVKVSFSKVGPKHRLRNWISGLVLAAAQGAGEGDGGRGAVWIGRGARGPVASTAIVAPDPTRARQVLQGLVAIRDLGMRLPLPLTPKLAWAYAGPRVRSGAEQELAWQDAVKVWSESTFTSERDEPAHQHCWPGAELADIADLPGISALPVAGRENTMFGNLAVAIWKSVVGDEVES